MRSRSRVVRAGGSRKRHARVAARVAPGSRGGGRWARASSPRASSPPRERLRPVAVENGNAAVSGPSDAHVRGAIDAIDAIDAWCFRASPRSRDDARREDARREIENDPSGLGCRSSAGWNVPPRARGRRREPSSGPWRRICCDVRRRGGRRRGQSRGRARVRGRYPGGRPIATTHRSRIARYTFPEPTRLRPGNARAGAIEDVPGDRSAGGELGSGGADSGHCF